MMPRLVYFARLMCKWMIDLQKLCLIRTHFYKARSHLFHRQSRIRTRIQTNDH